MECLVAVVVVVVVLSLLLLMPLIDLLVHGSTTLSEKAKWDANNVRIFFESLNPNLEP